MASKTFAEWKETHPELFADAMETATKTPSGRRGKNPRECECGCKDEHGNPGMTKGGHFIPGHDAKLKSAMIAAIRADLKAKANRTVKALTNEQKATALKAEANTVELAS